MDVQSLIVNGTSNITVQTENLPLQIFLISIPAIFSFVIGWKTISLMRNQTYLMRVQTESMQDQAESMRVQTESVRKEHERTAMIDIFRMLNQSDHKTAEDELITLFKNGQIPSIFQSDPNLLKYAKTVWRNYDQIGLLVNEDLIPREKYYHTYGVLTVVSYFVLKSQITQERLRHPHFMINFKQLAIDCLQYCLTNKIPVINPSNGMQITMDNLTIEDAPTG